MSLTRKFAAQPDTTSLLRFPVRWLRRNWNLDAMLQNANHEDMYQTFVLHRQGRTIIYRH